MAKIVKLGRCRVVRMALILFFFLSSLAFASVDCHDLNKVAQEGVAYSMLGAWTPITTHACFKNEKYHYFHPELGYPIGEISKGATIYLFDKNRDHYAIKSIHKKDDRYEFAVDFTIDGKALHTTYIYGPKPDFAKNNNICGYIVNYDHGIFRKDCVISNRMTASLIKK